MKRAAQILLAGMTLWMTLGLTASVSAAGMVVAAGGGAEGAIGDTSAWSYRLYKRLLQTGDVTGDQRIRVVILSAACESRFLPEYFQWLGAHEALNLKIASREDANDPNLLRPLESADVVFIKGGEAAQYYDLWNETLLETQLRTVVQQRGGSIGGTSAGAMILAQYAFSGGQELQPLDVLADAHARGLQDQDGRSGIHSDFLGFLPELILDTHYTGRGRLGRLLGLHAATVQEQKVSSLLGLGLDERTGLVFQGQLFEVVGQGGVDVVQQTPTSVLRRVPGQPLLYTQLRLDRLTEGWRFDLRTHQPDTVLAPPGTLTVTYAGGGPVQVAPLAVHGHDYKQEGLFQRVIQYEPQEFAIQETPQEAYIPQAFGILNAHNRDYRGAAQESMMRALYEFPGFSGFLLADSGQVTRGIRAPELLNFQRNGSLSYSEAATLVLSGKSMTHRGLSPYVSNEDSGSGRLKAPALINLRVHVLSQTPALGVRYHIRTQDVLGPTSP